MITTLKNDINFNCDYQPLNIDEYFESKITNNDNNDISNNDISNNDISNNDITDISYSQNYNVIYNNDNLITKRKIIINDDLENDTSNQDIRTNLTIEDMLNIEKNKKLDKNDNLLINDTEIDMSNNNFIKNHILDNSPNKKSNYENIFLSIDQFEIKKDDKHYMCNIL